MTCLVFNVLYIIIILYILYNVSSARKNTLLTVVALNVTILFNSLLRRHFMLSSIPKCSYTQNRIAQLLTKFNYGEIHILPINNMTHDTAYTVNKQILYVCLENKVYPRKIYNINTIMFVILHELTHMANNNWQHGVDFWQLFKFFINEAVIAGVYVPINYKVQPEIYCNSKIEYNPYFDQSLNLTF